MVGRHLFYNHSAFDGENGGADAADDDAVAPDKAALLPGQAASVANISSYVRGINGVMLDVLDLPTGANLEASDFTFSVGSNGSTSSWSAAPAPLAVNTRRGAGDGGSDRVTIVWADGAILDQWLRVTVAANPRTRLATPEVFFFGSLAGETGDRPAAASVTALDLAGVRRHLNSAATPSSTYDFNRDGRVDALDLAAVRAGLLRSLVMPTALAAAAPFGDDRITALLD